MRGDAKRGATVQRLVQGDAERELVAAGVCDAVELLGGGVAGGADEAAVVGELQAQPGSRGTAGLGTFGATGQRATHDDVDDGGIGATEAAAVGARPVGAAVVGGSLLAGALDAVEVAVEGAREPEVRGRGPGRRGRR